MYISLGPTTAYKSEWNKDKTSANNPINTKELLMSKLSFLKAPVSLIAGLVLSVSASANLIQNGSFENGDYSQQNYSWVTVGNGQSNITGWDIGGVAVDWHNSSEFSPIQDGLRAVDLNLNGGSGQTGTLSQTFATNAGTSYILDFYFAGPNTNFPNARQVQVDIAGSTTIFDQIASPNLDLVWGMHSLSFTAIDASTTLTFSSVDSAGYWGAVIDDVSVKVPEPASLALLTLGLAGLGFSRRKAR
jgi:choice-of-anchor C domain-containing protein